VSDRPNLLYVFADQLRYQSVGCAGDRRAQTPNIDRLASQGVSFVNAVSSTPVCAAYRASLFTGKYTTSTGMVINELRINSNHRCLGHVVTEAGYQTAYIGKWHLWANQLGNHLDPKNSFTPRGPYRLGFDGFWASYGFHHEYWNAYYHTESPRKIVIPGYEPDGQTDLAIHWLREQRDASAPFCMILSYGTPHDPWGSDNVPEEYRRRFAAADFTYPPNYLSENDDPYADAWARFKPGEREQLADWMRGYYAMAANLDANLGRLLAALDEMGLADDTILVFTSDHGEMFGAHGRRAKNIFYEEAIRVPFLLRWPGRVGAGSVCDACLGTVDIMPTLLGLAGLEAPREVEGTDLSLRALGRPGPEPEAALLQNTGACAAWEDGHEWRALRDRRWTYAKYRVDGRELLFDNAADPLQMIDLAGDPAHAATLGRLRRMLATRMEALNDTFPASTWYRDHWIEDRVIKRTATMNPV
jgi:arylsulfatase A-like enzyme